MPIYLVSLAILMDLVRISIQAEGPGANTIIISRPPKDYFPKSGNLQLSCEAEGNPMPSITWFDAQSMLPVEEEKSIDLKLYKDVGLLIIQKPVDKEIYEFYCNASNSYHWVISKTVRTGRAFLTSMFRQEPFSIQVVKPLQTVLLTCRPPIGIPYPKVHWMKDGKVLFLKSFVKNVNRVFFLNHNKNRVENDQWFLKITQAEAGDSGWYQCVASNDYGRVESSGSWVVVTDNTDTSFNVRIQNKLATLNNDVTFLCDSKYNRKIKWISSKVLSMNSRINISGNSLTIREITLQDKGLYACQSHTINAQLLKLYRLNVGSPDIIEEKTKSRKKVVIEGVNVVLDCDLENSQTEFYWETPNSQPIFPQDSSQSRIQVSSNGNLNIKSVQASDSGKYTCNAHSSLDVAHKSIWLEVSKHQLDNYPIISVPCQNSTVARGSNINLGCEVIGEDILKIIWYRGINIKQRLQNSDRILFPSKDSVTIINADLKDTNFYTCEAVNDQGRKASWTAFVHVIESYQLVNTRQSGELPLPPVVESPKNIKSTSLDLTWSSTSNQDPDTAYWIEYVYFGSSIGWSIYKKGWREAYITVENLNPDTWYQFLVRSKNRNGIGRASVPTEYVRTKRNDKPSVNIGFTFSKIKLHIPVVEHGRSTKLIWSLNRITIDDKSQSEAQFYLLYQPLSVLECIVAMSNGYEFESNSAVASLNNYCSLAVLSTDKLRAIKDDHVQGVSNESSTKVLIDLSKVNMTLSRDLNYDNYALMSWIAPNFTAFTCLNVSIMSDREGHYRTLHSNHRLLLTAESRPGLPPDQVRISWVLPEISINIKWRMPAREYWNGVLTGSNIYMKSNESEIVLKYNDSQTHKIIRQVNADLDWTFHISITNCVGESDKSSSVVLKRLSSSFGVQRINESIFRKSWVIAILVITSLLIWVMLCCLTAYLCCIRSNNVRHHKPSNAVNTNATTTTTKHILSMDTFLEASVETEKILQEVPEDKSSSNHCTSSAKSSGQSSSPSNVSFCNPYASTQLFDGVHDNKPTDLNLFYLSTPIFDPLPANKTAPIPLNYYLSNVPDWVGNQIMSGSFQPNPKLFPFHFPDEYQRNSNDSDSMRATKSQLEDGVVTSTAGTISNLLISTAPFSDQFSASSKGKSTPNSSNSDSTNVHTHMDSSTRYGLPNLPIKPSRRRQDLVDLYVDQSTEMTHLLIDNKERSSPSIARVYDIPYSESSVDSREISQSKE